MSCNLTRRVKSGGLLTKQESYFHLTAVVFLEVFVELIPLLVVLAVQVVHKGGWDDDFFKSTDLALTMVFFNLASSIDIKHSSESELDKYLDRFSKYLASFFVIIFTIIYVFSYLKLPIEINKELMMGIIAFSILIVSFLKAKRFYWYLFSETKNKKFVRVK